MLYQSRPISSRAFTLIEILIVVVILGILAAITIPQLAGATGTANANTMKEDVRFMRQEIEACKYQHNDVSPGYPSGNATSTPTTTDFIAQLSQPTDSAYTILDTPTLTTLGPYLTSMPVNPVTGLSTVLIVGNGATLPDAADGQYGWVYQPSTMTFRSDAIGSDQSGVSYYSY